MSFFYPAAGVTAAAMILSRRTVWPWIAVSVVAAELLADIHYGAQTQVSIAFAIANIVQSAIGAAVVRTCCAGRPDLRRRRDFAAFVAGSCAITRSRAPGLDEPRARWCTGRAGRRSSTWWAGDAQRIGDRVADPALAAAVGGAAAALGDGGRTDRDRGVVGDGSQDRHPTVGGDPSGPGVGGLPIGHGAATAGALAAFLADTMVRPGTGLFSRPANSPEAQLVVTQVYVAVIVVVAMLVAQEAGARVRAVQERETERLERTQLETLSRLAHRLSAALTPEDIGRALRAHVLDEAGARAVNLYLASAASDTLDLVSTSGHPPSLIDRYGRGIPLSEHSRWPATSLDRRRSTSAPPTSTPRRIPRTGGLAGQRGSPDGGGPAAGMRRRGLRRHGAALADPQPLDAAQQAYISAVATTVSQALVRAQVYVDDHARAAVLHSVVQPIDEVDVAGLLAAPRTGRRMLRTGWAGTGTAW